MPGVMDLPAGMIQGQARVLFNREITADHFQMRLKTPTAARRARPGQFVHVLCEGRDLRGRSPLLRRPLSLSDTDPWAGTMDFIYKVVGLGTNLLAQIRTGDSVDFLGPLGRPFEMPLRSQVACLVGGGVGIPPLYFLAKQLRQQGISTQVFLGARTKKWVICTADFRKLGLPVHVATDDGTQGFKGSVVDLVKKELSFPPPTKAFEGKLQRESSTDPRVREDRFREDDCVLYVCGPTPMMAAAARLARELGIPAQVSLEERMGCAMGVCMGCVVEVTTEPAGSHARFQRVCTEGPVFDAEEILWRNPNGV